MLLLAQTCVVASERCLVLHPWLRLLLLVGEARMRDLIEPAGYFPSLRKPRPVACRAIPLSVDQRTLSSLPIVCGLVGTTSAYSNRLFSFCSTAQINPSCQVRAHTARSSICSQHP